MIVIPPQDPNERRSDPIAEALGKLYDEITQAQDVGNFYGALVKRQELFKAQQQNIEDNFDQYQNMHPRDFYRQFHRQADDDDKAVISEVPYGVRQRLKDSLFDYRQPAFERASRTYKLLFVNHQLIRLAQDKEFLLDQAADALSDQERDLWLGALARRIQESGDRGILHKQDAEAAIANIPSDYDTAVYTRDVEFDPVQARELLAGGAYPNISPQKRAELLGLSAHQSMVEAREYSGPLEAGDVPALGESNSETNEEPGTTSNDQNISHDTAEISSDTGAIKRIETAAAPGREKPSASKQGSKQPDERGDRRAAYGETNGLYPQLNTVAGDPYRAIYDPKKTDPDSLKELQKARTDIAQVERNRRAAGATTGIQRKDVRSGDANEEKQWKLASDAANQPSDLPPDVRHFFMRAHTGPQKPDWAGDRQPYRTYGPFINVGGGPVPKSTLVYVDFYQGVPLAKDKGR